MKLRLSIVLLVTLTPLAVWAQPSIAGSYSVHQQGSRRPARAVVVPGQDGLELTIFNPGGASARFFSTHRDSSSGAWTFSRTRSVGVVGRLESEGGSTEVIRLQATSKGRLTGERKWASKTRRIALIPKRRLLVVLSAYRVYADRLHARFQALRLEVYYRLKGYETERVSPQNWEELTTYLESESNDPFKRVVFITHGGYDGPVLGYEDDEDDYFVYPLMTILEDDGELPGTRQLAPEDEDDMWTRMVKAVHASTTAKAKVYVSACHAGGSDAGERETASGYLASLTPWVTLLADATGRAVVGPAGYTSWHNTFGGVMAMEEGRPSPQELVWAGPNSR